MNRNILLALLVVASTPVFAPAFAKDHLGPCPDASLGEAPEDCPWAAIARSLIASDTRKGGVLPLLKKEAPEIVKQLERVRHLKEYKALWSESINFDELAHGQIVDPAILRALGEAAQETVVLHEGPTPNEMRAHAGLEHTYGYLFSVLKTSFGYKRARWVQGEVEHGFKLPDGLVGPNPREGSLFGNVTYFAGRIAFRGETAALETLDRSARAVPAAILKYDFNSLHPRRLVETVELASGRRVALRTDIVPFLAPSGGGDAAWLVYSILDSAQGGPRLVTAFPVASSFADMVFKPENLGSDQPIITRYNGYVEGVTGAQVRGTREAVSSEIAHASR